MNGLLFGQEISVNDFLEVSSLSSQKFDNYLSKKGYIPAGKTFQNDTIIDTWQQIVKVTEENQNPLGKRIAKYQWGKEISYCFQTPSRQEYEGAISSIRSNGFFCGNEGVSPDSSVMFQKKNITIQAYSFKEEGIVYYSLFFHQQQMPARTVKYADDLLQFTSHEYLANYFGAANVVKDFYFFSEKELNKCSVLFPNSTRQVVFIWKDEYNLKDLSYILIGGNMSTKSSVDFNQQIRENTWVLDNGIRFNMRLGELLKLNGEDFTFFGRKSDNFLTIDPRSKGNIDFATTGIVLDCLNCESASFLNKEQLLASDVLDQRISLYVGMIMLIPGSETAKKYASR